MAWRFPQFVLAGLTLLVLVMAGCHSRQAFPPDVEAVFAPGVGARENSALVKTSFSPYAQVPSPQASGSAEKGPQPGTVRSLIQPTSLLMAAEKPAVHPQAVDTGAVLLNLSTAIEIGLTQNPDLVTLRETEPVGAAGVDLARAFQFNPVVQTRILPYGRFPRDVGDPKTNYYVLFWHTFELAHQRKYREKNAAANLDNIHWTIQQAQLQNVAQTSQLYLTALYNRGLRDLAHETARLNGKLLSVMEKRFQAGGASATDLAVVRLDARAAEQQARLADIALQNALRALQRHLNLAQDMPVLLEGDLTDLVWHPITGAELCKLTGPASVFVDSQNRDALVANLVGGRPDVVAVRANLEAARANVELARASRIPNLTIGPFYSHDTAGTVNAGFQAEMAIPVLNTGRELVQQREAQMQQQMTAVVQLEAKARVEALTALDRYEQIRALCQTMSGERIHQLPEELQKLEKQFIQGDIDILRLTQARTSLLQFQRTYLDSLNELAQAAAALTQASGLPPAAFVSYGEPAKKEGAKTREDDSRAKNKADLIPVTTIPQPMVLPSVIEEATTIRAFPPAIEVEEEVAPNAILGQPRSAAGNGGGKSP